MPISVSCPSCSAQFNVKDVYAGKRAKCPKCGNPLTIPGSTPSPAPAAPVLARPVVASRPKPAGDEDEAPKSKRRRDDTDDDKPKSKRRRDEDDQDDEDEVPKSRRRREEDVNEDDKPRAKGRTAVDDADEGKPRSRRRRGDDDDDDDKPKKKGSALPLILGIVGGILLLCGGGCAGVWFGVIQPGIEKAKKDLHLPTDLKGTDLTTPAAPAALEVTALAVTAEYEQDKQGAAGRYEGKKLRITGRVTEITDGGVLLEGTPKSQPAVVVLFVNDAKKLPHKVGDWVAGEGTGAGWYNNGGKYYLQIQDCQVSVTPPPPGWTPTGPDTTPTPDPTGPLVITDAEMIDRFLKDLTGTDRAYGGRQVKLTGRVVEVSGTTLSFGGKEADNYAHFISVKMAGQARVKKGDTVTVVAKYQSWETSLGGSRRTITLTDGRLDNTPAAPPPDPAATLTADQLADQADKYTGKVVTVSGAVKRVNEHPDGGGSVEYVAGGGKKTVRATFLSDKWTKGKLKPGDVVGVTGTVIGAAGDTVDVSRCELVLHQAGSSPTPSEPSVATLTVAELLQDYQKYTGKVVTVTGKVFITIEELNRLKGTVVFQAAEGGKPGARAVLDKGNWRSGFLQGEDTVELKGRVGGLVGNPTSGQYVELADAELLKRTTKDGKDVPIPAKVDPPKTPSDDEAIEVKAADLLDEFLKDAKDAEAKYKGKLLKVVGTTTSISPAIIKFAGKTEKDLDPKTKKTVEFDCYVHATIADGGKIFEDTKGKTTVIGVFKRFDVNDFGAKKSKVVHLEQCKQVK